MASKIDPTEPHARPELTSRWNDSFDVSEPFWATAEEAAVEKAQQRMKHHVPRHRRIDPWQSLAAACVIGAAIVGLWHFATPTHECVTFACLWDAQTDLPLTPDELDMLDRWETGYDDIMFTSTSF